MARHAWRSRAHARSRQPRHARRRSESFGIRCIDPGSAFGPFVLNHEPGAVRGGYALAGHIHPAVRLRGEGDSLRLPCFWFGARYGVLPAFGAFTGNAEVRPRQGDQVYVIADEEVIRIG
jgi:metallophosphoesterase superfamily enzyme